MNCLDGLYFYIAICVSKSASRVFLKGEYESPIFFFLLDPGHVHCLVYLLLKFICALLGLCSIQLLLHVIDLHGIQLGS